MSKKVQKSDKNICTVIFLPLSLHPQSGNNTGCDGSEKGYQQLIKQNVENFSKKVSKKFGGYKNLLYLCNRFPLQMRVEVLKTVL
ncbi:MAG: hypothetical protein IKY93_04690 [Alistipes sp.]|nr:hypothetical protein [Alistipes sp.]